MAYRSLKYRPAQAAVLAGLDFRVLFDYGTFTELREQGSGILLGFKTKARLTLLLGAHSIVGDQFSHLCRLHLA